MTELSKTEYLSTENMNFALNVPFFSQLRNRYRNNCLPCCVLMLAGWLRQQQQLPPIEISPDDLKIALGGNLNSAWHIDKGILAARRMGFRLRYMQLDDDALSGILKTGNPVIALVLHRHLLLDAINRFDGGHFMVVCGDGGTFWMVLDPNNGMHRDTAFRKISKPEFKRARTDVPNSWFKFPNQTLVIA